MKTSDGKFDFIERALSKRKESAQFRTLKNIESYPGTAVISHEGKEYVNFSSNDYLGLSFHPEVISRSKQFAEKYGAGSGASRLVTGSKSIHDDLEQKLADFTGFESALLFSSGFQANLSILSAIADRNSLIIADKQIHNSLIQGALLSRAHFQRFEHNDFDHLESLLQKAKYKKYNRIWVVTETLFSMDGDSPDLDEIIHLSRKYGALVYSDDAHALGVWGEKGKGLNFGKSGIDISIGTFGKSFGSFGAFVACSQQMKKYLINFASGFIYSTALPPSVIGTIGAALEIILEMKTERKLLFDHIEYLIGNLNDLGFDTLDSSSQIIPVVIGSESESIDLSNQLKENGLWVSAIRPPTVPDNASRLRITLSVLHTKEQIDQLLKVLGEWKRK